MSDQSEYESDQVQQSDTIFETIVVKTVRTALALNNSNQSITKANLQKYAYEDVSLAKVNFSSVLYQANVILYDTYGLQLKLLPSKESGSGNRKKKSPIQHYIVVNALNDGYLSFIQESNWIPCARNLFESELSEKRHDYTNNKERYPTLSNDETLLANGLTLVILAIIIVSNNHLNESELLETLNDDFGIDKNELLDVVNQYPLDFLKQLDKSEYIRRNVLKSSDSTDDEVVEISVGRRAVEEFSRESFTEFVKIIYNEPDENEVFEKLIEQTMEGAYGKVQ